jgi:hypothetical protein
LWSAQSQASSSGWCSGLHGTIPGILPSSRDGRNDAALVQLEPHVFVLLASVLLWLYRDEGVLTKHNAWGQLQDVGPATAKAAAASSLQDSG